MVSGRSGAAWCLSQQMDRDTGVFCFLFQVCAPPLAEFPLWLLQRIQIHVAVWEGRGMGRGWGVTLVSAPWQDPEEHGCELGEGDHAVSQCLR